MAALARLATLAAFVLVLTATNDAPAQRGGPGSAPRVVTERPTVRGSMPSRAALHVLRRHVRDVKRCYERSLREHGDLRGRLTLRLVVAADGGVQHAEARAKQGLLPEVFECIERSAATWRFPSTGGGMVMIDWAVRMDPPTDG